MRDEAKLREHIGAVLAGDRNRAAELPFSASVVIAPEGPRRLLSPGIFPTADDPVAALGTAADLPISNQAQCCCCQSLMR
ncbi:uncharacterized protein K452DRAFT_55384 [Aplosporella prunicola CBS 121167]|uniref:Uncharacterized protein n=1 Tax=Aplosporella prunicola CBS 121167 TaxID=1176127 RepID=A0A6A6B8X2_9PEZI|nr:uncharacterized protein K452DRAFT_55384 [Aplosporella prunicola CBS 121167]KAF2140406.1 hypothetical protein K452DRAFT_55384 [Aplosporella prunicola CBS 121167]